VTEATRIKASRYIHWAKTYPHVRFDLATSAVMPCPVDELPFEKSDIEINARGAYGYEPLIREIASKFNADPRCVVHANGTSMANHLAMATILEREDEVLIEKPAYEPLVSLAHYLGANVKRFERREEGNFGIDVSELERLVSSRTRLIVITNLHNPTSTLTPTETLRDIGEIAKDVGARVLVDEVYLEALFDRDHPSAFHLGSRFIVTGSLTKAYGLGGLRCGWVLAEPPLAEQIWRLKDLFGVIPPRAVERLSVIALKHLDSIAGRARRALEVNRPILHRFLDSRQELRCARPQFGTVVSPRLLRGDVDQLAKLLFEKYDTAFVPGRFFEMPDHFRLGIGCESEVLAEGLRRLGSALDEVSCAS
jgi:aspartate/methionine/tyrosine aminotransferase